MRYRKIIAVCPEIHTKHTNALRGQNVEFVNVKRGGTYSNHASFKEIRKMEKCRKEIRKQSYET
jgi:hypothetical protein